MYHILTAEEVSLAEAATIQTGVDSFSLMESAGLHAAKCISTLYTPQKTLVLCGPGHNGGDGFITAHYLQKAGFEVVVAFGDGDVSAATGNARIASELYDNDVISLDAITFDEDTLVIDALFGTGLNRVIAEPYKSAIQTLNDAMLQVVSLDLPSGVDASTGRVASIAVEAVHTVAFTRKKRGHVLLPGAHFVGDVHVVEVGVLDEVIEALNPNTVENIPYLWLNHMPWPRPEDHKYARGHVAIYGGPSYKNGAALLAARAAERSLCGAVSIIPPEGHWPAYLYKPASIMVHRESDVAPNAILIGPGYGVGEETVSKVCSLLERNIPIILDADGLMSFKGNVQTLADAIKKHDGRVVITPHLGEFEALFPETLGANKVEMARHAANMLQAVVVLKGFDTVITAPDCHTVINTNADPVLATAGSGDVLSGMIAGLVAAGTDLYYAAAVAVYAHAAAAPHTGLGMIAEDIPMELPLVWRDLLSYEV